MSRKTLTERVAELEEQVRALQLAKIVDPPYYPSYPVPPVWPQWPSSPSRWTRSSSWAVEPSATKRRSSRLGLAFGFASFLVP